MAKMNKAWFVGFLVAMLGIPALAFAADMSDWGRFAPLEIHGSNKYKAVFLTDEVYAHALPNLADLRLVDNASQHVPFYIQAGNVTLEQNETLITTRSILSFKKDDDRYFDYAVAVQTGIDPTANKLVFGLLPNRNFVKQIEIYGSYDNVKWQLVTNGQIYRVDGRIRNEVLLGEVRRFSYYRVKMPDNNDDLVPGEMKLAYAKYRAEWSRYERSFIPETEMKNEQRETIITVRNPNMLHIKRIVFDVGDNFQRNYSIFDDVRSLSPLQSGEIYNLQFSGVNIANKGISLRKQLSANAFVIKINNRDDRPLPIKEIRAEYFVDKLVFQDLGTGPYRLYFANSKAEKPVYEMALQQIFVEKEPQDNCIIAASLDNTGTTKFWPEIQDNYLVNGAIASISLVLIFTLVRTLSKRNT